MQLIIARNDACAPFRRSNTPAMSGFPEGARDMARDIAKTEAYRTSRCQRKKVEMLFAHLKTHLEARPAAITRTERCPRRVPPRRRRPKPPKARQADPGTAADPGDVRVAPITALQRPPIRAATIFFKADFFNTIRRFQPFVRAGTGSQAADHGPPTKPPLPIIARRRGGRLRRAIAV
jgi:hypothetical protein